MFLICFEICAQEAKCNQIIDLLDAHAPQKEIVKIIDVSERTVQCIQHAKILGRGTNRAPGSGGHHRKRSKVFLETFKDKIMKDPTVSMRRHAKTLNVYPKTIKTAITPDLGLKSFFRQPQHLLIESIKEKKFERFKRSSLSSNTMAGPSRYLAIRKYSLWTKFIIEGMTAELH